MSPYTAQQRIRTIDSFLMNPNCVSKILYVDEALMAHAGAILAIAKLSRAEEVWLYGDQKQIPFINFHPAYHLKYGSWEWFDKTKVNKVSHRCPIDVVAGLSAIYDGELLTSSTVRDSMSYQRIESVENLRPQSGVQYLTFLRADKAELIRRGFGKVLTVDEYNVNTVHEVQGETYEHVILVRLTASRSEIFDSQPHCVVAVSRHTQSFVYCSTGPNDLVRTIIERSGDPFRRQLARV
jgi:hypothetical protein